MNAAGFSGLQIADFRFQLDRPSTYFSNLKSKIFNLQSREETRTEQTSPQIGAIADYPILQRLGSGLERSFSTLFASLLGEGRITETFGEWQSCVFEELCEAEVFFR
jgi:hypothetical protein